MLIWLKKMENYKKVGTYKLKKISKFLKACIKMENATITFGDIKIHKQKLHQHKGPILIKNIDLNKTVVSDKFSIG